MKTDDETMEEMHLQARHKALKGMVRKMSKLLKDRKPAEEPADDKKDYGQGGKKNLMAILIGRKD